LSQGGTAIRRGSAQSRLCLFSRHENRREDELMEHVFDRITIDPGKMNGQPCVRGLRLTVRRLLEALNTYPSREELRADYPEIEDEDIHQAIAYAAAMMGEEIVETKAAS
jgi:uncharacterized protein (DUF433 family)